MSIKAVLFDLDGTLLDRDTSLDWFVRDQYDRYPQFHVTDRDVFVKRFIELDIHGYVWKDKVYQQLITGFSIPGVEWTELLNDYLVGFQRHCVGFPNLIDMLTALKNSGLRIALISNGYGQFQYDNFKSHRALSKLGVEATEAIFVGDHPENDIRASRAVGMKAAWKRNDTITSDVVDADLIIDDLGELIRYILG